jgi:uncharacterized coiled-coil DUF342 family protein
MKGEEWGMSGENRVARLEELFTQHKGIIEQLKKIRTRRAELKNEIVSLTQKLDVENDQHKLFQAKMKELNDSRMALAEKLRSDRIKLKAADEAMKGVEPKLLRKGEGLEDELKKLEWRLQTQPLTRAQEQEVLVKVKELAKSVSVWRKAFNIREEVYKLESALDESSGKMMETKAEREEVVGALKEKRQKIRNYIEARKQVSDELRAVDVDIIELEKTLSEIDGKIAAAREELAKERTTQRISSSRVRADVDRMVLEKARSDALAKMKSGKSLTFDELRVLYDEDISSSNN